MNFIAIVLKVWIWLKANAASLIGVIQALVKALKELLTAAVNLISIFVPVAAQAVWVEKVRGFFNWIDGGLEWVKVNLIPKLV